MEITIKSYKSCRADEGDAYSCTMYLDGKKAALVRYGGTGGPVDFDFSVAAGKANKWMSGPVHDRFKAYCASLPKTVCEWDDPKTGKPAELDQSMDCLVEDAINLMMENRQIKRWCKKETVFRVKGDKAGAWRTFSLKFPGNEARVKTLLAKKYGDQIEEIANERFAA